MKKLTLPIINSDRIMYNNFYSVCIKAIELNNDKILNKSEVIKNIEKLRDKSLINSGEQFLSQSYFNNSIISKKIKNLKKKKLPDRKRTLKNIILELENKESKSFIQKILPIKIGNAESNMIALNKNEEKKSIESYDNKITKTMPLINKEEKKPPKQIDFSKKMGMIKDLKKVKTYSKRHMVLKKVLQYLESNDITLFEYLKHNPFQKRPYQISKSFEFMNAVKFKNYEFVYEALQYSKSYLFSFDYFGQTCYHWAAKLSNIKMLTILINYGKYHNQQDFKGRTPLYLAAVNNDKEICELLLKNKANVHLSDEHGNTPADVAGSKELKYYLGDYVTQPYTNINCKKRVADFLRVRDEKEREKRRIERLKKIEEEKKLRKERGEEEEEEEQEENNEDE